MKIWNTKKKKTTKQQFKAENKYLGCRVEGSLTQELIKLYT